MKEKEILSLTAVQLGKKIKEREVTCREALGRLCPDKKAGAGA